jgi:hypothetical protein
VAIARPDAGAGVRHRQRRFRHAACVGCSLIVGIVPALQLARVDPQAALRSGARAAGRSRMRQTLMAIEVGLALVVLLAAGLLWRSFSDAREIDPALPLYAPDPSDASNPSDHLTHPTHLI